MEVQLQQLIDQIKQEGVEAAEAEAQAIVQAAEQKAQQIVAAAQAQADKLLLNAKTENDRVVKSGEDALRQAGRNLLLSFRESVARELQAIVGEQVSAVYSSQALQQLILSAVEGWTGKPDAEQLTVMLNAEDLQKLEQTVLAALKQRMLQGVTLKANDRFDGGFRIAVGDSGAYYDYSAQQVVQMLSNYLSPKVTELLKEA